MAIWKIDQTRPQGLQGLHGKNMPQVKEENFINIHNEGLQIIV